MDGWMRREKDERGERKNGRRERKKHLKNVM